MVKHSSSWRRFLAAMGIGFGSLFLIDRSVVRSDTGGSIRGNNITTPFPSAGAFATVNYAPPGEFVKDHSFVYHDGVWHMFSISGPLGRGWIYKPGGEETFSHSISNDLINWEFAGHVLEPGGPGTIDADKIWAPYVITWNGTFYMFYSGVVHPNWELTPGATSDPSSGFWKGHMVSMCLATSKDLVTWEKHTVTKPLIEGGGQDPHVLYDEDTKRFHLYCIGGGGLVVSESDNLLDWSQPKTCLKCSYTDIPWSRNYPTESPFVLKYKGIYYLLLNDAYYISDTPLHFSGTRPYRQKMPGFAGEIIQMGERFIRTSVEGKTDYYTLRMQEIALIGDHVILL